MSDHPPHCASGSATHAILPAAPSARVQRVFAWYSERLLRKRFAAVRATVGTSELLAACGDGVQLLLMSHASWWDPIIGSFLWRRHWPGHACRAPMDRRQLERFRFMRKLGVFGIDPDHPGSLDAMVEYLLGERDAAGERLFIAITPQGRFVDPREPIAVRPGAAAIAARLGVRSALCLAIEYAFWNEQRPEVFLRAERVGVDPQASTATWHRAIAAAMESNRQTLAEAVISREATRFENVLAPRSDIHPVYDLWLRVTGRGVGITADHRRDGGGSRASLRVDEVRA